MKKDILKIAGVKSEKEFYKKYPTEEAFMKAHNKEFKKAAMGAAMVNKQLTQLTDFSNPPQAQRGDWVQRAANANLSFWEKCRLASSADNGGGGRMGGGSDRSSKYKNAYEEISDIKSYEKDERKAFEKSRPEDVDIADWVAVNRDASRMNAILRNPDYDKYTDEQGVLKPEYQSVATRFDPYYLYYKPAFSGKKEVSPTDILEYQKSQPGGLAGYRELVNRGYRPQQQQYGGSTTPQDQVGGYMGGEQAPAYKPMNYTELYDQAEYANTGKNRQMRMQEANLAAQQTMAENSKKKGIFDMLGQIAPQLDALNISTPSANQFAAADADMNANFAADIAAGMRYGGYVPKAQSGFIQGLTNFSNKVGKGIGQGYDKLDKGLGKVGGVPGALNIGTDLVQGFQQLKQERDLKRQARQSFELSGLTKQVAGLTPDIQQRKYVRPEDMAFGTQEMGQTYGAGTNFLAANGAMVGGNPTEIQNMYNPGDLYSDLGYEPLSDSEIVKQYRKGGLVPKAQFGDVGNALGSLIGGGKGRPTAGGKIGGTIGSTVGSFIPVPGAKQALEFVGSTVGSIFGGKSAKQTEKYQTGAQQNTQDAAFMSGAQGLRNQFSNVMEDGGWVSHNWQPQVITTFGEYKLKDLLRPPHDADMLRAGGHLKAYTAPSEAAMSTERPDFAMGGQLKTTWGGYAEPISHNPYLPGSGETVMFRGKSHDESDGNGHTGIGVKYGKGAHDSYTDYAEYGTEQAGADVEVERGEPATELPDAETGDVSMVVYGNMPIPSYGAAELGDPKIKGKKFKAYANDLSKMEAKQNKLVEKGTKLVDGVDSDSPFDLLKLNSGQAMIDGANMKLKGLAIQKQRLAGIQNAILDTAEEMGVESDALAKNKIKPIKDKNMAKFGGKFTQAQVGTEQPSQWALSKDAMLRGMTFDPSKGYTVLDYIKALPEVIVQAKKAAGKTETKKPSADTATETDRKAREERLKRIASIDITPKRSVKDLTVKTPNIVAKVPDYAKDLVIKKTDSEEKDKFGLDDLLRQVQPYLLPSNQEPFDYSQITPEMYALATNQLEPVQAQTFQPLLEQPYTVSLQDQLNANQADFNALQRQLGYNPAAASALAAQKYAANSAILGQQARINQELQMGAFNRNRGVLNDAALKNLAILDTQYQRQSQARSATKAQAQAALSSIADKIAKNKLENRTLGVYENMYNYRFGPKGRAYNVNAPYEFNTALATMSTQEIEDLLNKRKEAEKKSTKSTAKNGSIVKAIKNL